MRCHDAQSNWPGSLPSRLTALASLWSKAWSQTWAGWVHGEDQETGLSLAPKGPTSLGALWSCLCLDSAFPRPCFRRRGWSTFLSASCRGSTCRTIKCFSGYSASHRTSRSFQSTLASNVLLPATCLTFSVVSSTVCASLILAECLGSLLLFYHATLLF